jgi:3-methyladenine DNA glycosylase AlkD
MTAAEILAQLKPLGKESYRKVMRNHGVPDPLYGVSIEDMKKIFVKSIKRDYQLALDLYDTGVYDAMYLAGLIADDKKMTKQDLQKWADHSTCDALSEYTVAWVAAESNHGRELALKWIDSKKERIAVSGWATLSSLVAITDDAELDLDELTKLLDRVKTSIHQQSDRLQYVMNGWVIAVGTYVEPVSERAMKTAKEIGALSCKTVGACKVPFAPDYLQKVMDRGAVGKKRKSAKC